MTVVAQTTDITQLTTEQLEELLKKRKADDSRVYEKRKADYERRRNALIDRHGRVALGIARMLTDLKAGAFKELLSFRDAMMEYGDLRNGDKNKGNFSIQNANFKIEFNSQVNKCFDERAGMAEEKLKSFLSNFIKKRDQPAYKLIMALLERNEKTGDFDIDNINRLYKMENDFEDQDWKDAIRLFKEAYNPVNTKQYIRFSRALPTGGYESIVLDFAKTRYDEPEKETAQGVSA